MVEKMLCTLGLHCRGPVVNYSSVSQVQEAIEFLAYWLLDFNMQYYTCVLYGTEKAARM